MARHVLAVLAVLVVLLVSLADGIAPPLRTVAQAARTSSRNTALSPPLLAPLQRAAAAPCKRCPSDWQQVSFVGVGPLANQTDLCSLVDTCATEVATW